MKRKLIGICVVTLLLSASVLSVAGNVKDTKNDVGSKTTNWSEQAKLIASDGTDGDWFGYYVSIDGDYIVMGAPGDDFDTGSAYIFKNTGTGWIEEAKLTASDGETGDWFGLRVFIEGDYVIIGAPADISRGIGSAYIFKNTGTGWIEEAKLTASDGATGDRFGWSVSISGDYIIIGALGDDSFTGSAYIFKNTGTGWIEEVKLTASDGSSGDEFGRSVSINNNYAIVGANEDDRGTGSAYIFKNTGTGWIEEVKLTASDSATNSGFGIAVSINDEYAIVGAMDADTGKAYIFKNTGTGWIEEAKLTASDGETGDWFGRSVSINDNYAIVGASHDDGNTGSVYMFKNTGTGWIEEAKLTASDGANEDRFGHTHSFNGDYLIIGSIWDDNENGDDSGSAYVFKRLLPDLECTGTIRWIEVKTGTTVTDDFNISNIGDTGTELNWMIESYPDWGIWTFNPSSGDGLTPEDGQVIVEVSVVAPEEKDMEFTGEIKVVNKDDSNDYSIIPVSLSTPKNKPLQLLFLQVLERFLENHPYLFPLLRHLLGL